MGGFCLGRGLIKKPRGLPPISKRLSQSPWHNKIPVLLALATSAVAIVALNLCRKELLSLACVPHAVSPHNLRDKDELIHALSSRLELASRKDVFEEANSQASTSGRWGDDAHAVAARLAHLEGANISLRSRVQELSAELEVVSRHHLHAHWVVKF